MVRRRALLRAAAVAAFLAGCGRPPGPVLEVAFAGVPGNGYVLGLLTDALDRAAYRARAQMRVTPAADWRPWVLDTQAPLPDVVLTAAPGWLPSVAGRLGDLGPVFKAAITARKDQLPAAPWVLPGRGGRAVQVALPVLADPLILLAASDFQADVSGQGFPFLSPGWRNTNKFALQWAWNPFVLSLARDQNAHLALSGVDLGLPDTGPALAMWLAAGWNERLADAGGGNWRATFADGVAAPRLESWQVPTLPGLGPHTGLSALLALMALAPGSGTGRLRFTHASTAAGGGGLEAGQSLLPAPGWQVLPPPVLPGGSAGAGRFLLAAVSAAAPPEAAAMVREALSPALQVEMAGSGWGVPATAVGFLQWAMVPYACRRFETNGAERWQCDPMPVATPVTWVLPNRVFRGPAGSDPTGLARVQANLYAALGALPSAGVGRGAQVLTAAQAAANADQVLHGAEQVAGVAFPGF